MRTRPVRFRWEGIIQCVRGALLLPCAGIVVACGEPAEPPLPDSLRAASITISPTRATMHDGDTVRFHATVLDNKGVEIAGAHVQWLVENDTILEIDSAGLARALTTTRLGARSTAVVARYFKVEGLAGVDYTMRAPLNVWPDTNAMFPGMTRTLVAREILAERGSPGPQANVVPVSWSSSDQTVVTVDASGTITAVGLGHARIIITSSDARSGSAEVYVVAAPATPLRFVSVSGDAVVVTRVLGGDVYENRACGLTAEGSVYCWGVPPEGAEVSDRCEQIQRVSPAFHGYVRYRCLQIPYRVPTDITFTSLMSRGSYSCGIATTRRVYCWGANNVGQLGVGTTDNLIHGVTPIASTDEFRSVHIPLFSIRTQSCALRMDGAMFCWGGALPSAPTAMNPEVRWRMMADAATCALAADSTAYCLPFPPSSSMMQAGSAHWASLAMGKFEACALSVAGRVTCNNGFSSTVSAFTREVAGDVTISSLGLLAVRPFEGQVCGLTAANEMYCVVSGVNGLSLAPRDAGALRVRSVNGPCFIATDDRTYCPRTGPNITNALTAMIAVPGQ